MLALAQARDHATRLQNDTLHQGLGVGLAMTFEGGDRDRKHAPECPLWVISGHCRRASKCPLYPRKPTCPLSATSGRSALRRYSIL
jgi:hypothetical protein